MVIEYRCLAFKHVYKVVAEICLEKCLIAKHRFYSVSMSSKQKRNVGLFYFTTNCVVFGEIFCNTEINQNLTTNINVPIYSAMNFLASSFLIRIHSILVFSRLNQGSAIGADSTTSDEVWSLCWQRRVNHKIVILFLYFACGSHQRRRKKWNGSLILYVRHLIIT